MSQRSHHILILEDDNVLNLTIREHLHRVLPRAQPLFARTISEGQILISQFDVDIFVLDINLPDGSGLDFLCDVKTVNPEAQAVMISAAPLRETKDRAIDLGATRFLEKPLSMDELGKLLGLLMNGAPVENANNFHGTLRQLQLVDVIQIKCLGKADSVLEFTNPEGERGSIHFFKGEIVHAETPNNRGVEAFNEVVKWKGGTFVESDHPVAHDRTIFTSWESLLMEAVRLADEESLPPL